MTGVCAERIALVVAEVARVDHRDALAHADEARRWQPHEGDCLACKRHTLVSLWPSMTAYEWDGDGEDPNAPITLCLDCGPEHIDQMEAQWDEYRRGLL